MNSVQPPTPSKLSDCVIRSVFQRVQRSRCSVNKFLENVAEDLNVHQTAPAHAKSMTIATPDKVTKRKRQRADNFEPPVKKTEAANVEDDAIDDGTRLKRHRSRVNQERYQQRRRKLTQDLENSVYYLRAEIQILEEKCEKISFGLSTNETVWAVAAEYFRVFRTGFLAPRDRQMTTLDFLHATMAPDVDAGTVRGLEALARNWRVFTRHFEDVHVKLERMQLVGEDLLLADMTMSITISTRSLEFAFPHLLKRRKGGDEDYIATRLLGQRLALRGSVRFDWDSSSNRVVSVISQVDMVTPLLQLLGKLELVSRVFDEALVNPEGNLVVDRLLYSSVDELVSGE